MKKILLGISILFFSFGLIWGTNNPLFLKKTKNSKEPTLLLLELDGPIQLFSKVTDTYEIVEVNENSFREIKTGVVKEYYIGNDRGEVVEFVIPANFKKVARKYFADTPELAKRIGKRGFRYENLPFMILYHNKLVGKGETLTAADVKQWNLLN